MASGADSVFKIRNGLVVNGAITVNSTAIYFSGVLTMNSSTFVGTSYTANNALNLGGAAASVYVNTSANFTIAGNHTHTGNVIFSGAGGGLVANGNLGSQNQVLLSNGTTPYWTGANAAIISGLATSATTDTTNASNITTGSLSTARISGLATSATTDTTNASNITTGTIISARLPADVVYTDIAAQVISGGARVTAYTIASGSQTLDSGNGPLQYYLNNQVATITAPSNDGSFVMYVNNAVAANTITWSGFTTAANYGDPYDIVSTHKFLFYVNRTKGISTFICKALQ